MNNTPQEVLKNKNISTDCVELKVLKYFSDLFALFINYNKNGGHRVVLLEATMLIPVPVL